MTLNQRKTVTYCLVQATKAYRHRAAIALGTLNLHAGQDQILKALAQQDGQTMGALAQALAVQPPTITKMVARLGAQDLLRREQNMVDARSSSVYLTDKGRALMDELDQRLLVLEQDALTGIDEKDRKRLRKSLRQIQANLGLGLADTGEIEGDIAGDASHDDK